MVRANKTTQNFFYVDNKKPFLLIHLSSKSWVDTKRHFRQRKSVFMSRFHPSTTPLAKVWVIVALDILSQVSLWWCGLVPIAKSWRSKGASWITLLVIAARVSSCFNSARISWVLVNTTIILMRMFTYLLSFISITPSRRVEVTTWPFPPIWSHCFTSLTRSRISYTINRLMQRRIRNRLMVDDSIYVIGTFDLKTSGDGKVSYGIRWRNLVAQHQVRADKISCFSEEEKFIFSFSSQVSAHTQPYPFDSSRVCNEPRRAFL